MLGSVTCQKVCQPEAPSVTAPSSSSCPCASMTGMSSRAIKGKVTKIVANRMPGQAKMILISCCCSQVPNDPWAPNSSTKTSPEMTGETEKGKSMRVTRKLFPRKENLVIAHDAANPKSRLSTTATVALNAVSLKAAIASG